MRIRDWSSDVCSSDLLEWRAEVPGDRLSELEPGMRADLRRPGDGALVHGKIRQLAPTVDLQSRNALVCVDLPQDAGLTAGQVDRKSAVWGKSVSVRVDIGCGRILEKKKNHIIL